MCVDAAVCAHTQTLLMNEPTIIPRANWGQTCMQMGTWNHTAEPTLVVTQTLALAAAVSVSLAGTRTRPPSGLSKKSLWTRSCRGTTQIVT